MTREIFLDAVLREVRFSLYHDEIRAELTGHLEDEGEYLAARDGLTTSEAEAEAVAEAAAEAVEVTASDAPMLLF